MEFGLLYSSGLQPEANVPKGLFDDILEGKGEHLMEYVKLGKKYDLVIN
jgi:hypothetical protein